MVKPTWLDLKFAASKTAMKKATKPSKIHGFEGVMKSMGPILGGLNNTNEPRKKRAPGWLGCIGDEFLPVYVGLILSHYKDRYYATSILDFFLCSNGNFEGFPESFLCIVWVGNYFLTFF